MSYSGADSGGHFGEMNALLYLEGEFDNERERAIVAHAAVCGECRHLLQSLQRENVWLRESLSGEEEAIPLGLARAPRRLVASWTWVAGAAMAAAGVYTLWSEALDPWMQQAAEAGFTQGNLLTSLFFSGAFWKGWDAMLNGVEFLALATIGIVLAWVLRRQRRQFSIAGMVLAIATVLLLGAPSRAGAAQVVHGYPNYSLPEGQEVKSDLIVAAQHTSVDGIVDGDLIVWSRSVTVNGHVKGDVLAFGQEIHVNGTVDGNVRTTAQSLTVDGTIGKNLMAWVRELYMDDKSRVEGTVTVGSSTAQLDGRVGGDLLAFVGDLGINGTLEQNAAIRAGRLTLGSGASIEGETKYRGGRTPDVAAGAKLGTPIQILERRGPRPRYASGRYYWRQILAWGASLIFGVVLFLIAPVFFTDVESASRRFGSSIGIGLLLLFAVPMAAILACFTIVGLGVGIATILLYIVALYSAQVFIGEWLGEKLLGARIGTAAMAGRLALGLAILRLIRMIPFLGGLVTFLVLLWGLGALALAIYRRIRPQFAPTTV